MVRRKTDAEFRAEVKDIVGDEYIALDRYHGAMTKIKFKHINCGNYFEMRPHDFLTGRRCPKCARKIRGQKEMKSNTKFKSEVSTITGKEYLVLDKYIGRKRKIRFKHQTCGFIFLMTPDNFLHGHRCPRCMSNLSKGEKIVENYLKKRKINFKAQFRTQDCKDKLALPFDFAVFNNNKSLNCLIEYQGAQHFINPFIWKKKAGPFNSYSVSNTQKHDVIKLQYCKKNGIKLITINHPEIGGNSDSIEFIERLVNRTLNKELHVI